MIKKSIITSLFLAISLGIMAQNTFSKRYDFGFSSAIINGISLRGDTIFAYGIVGDTLFPYNTGSFFALLDSNGELMELNTTIYPNEDFGLWGNSLVDAGDGFIATGYAIDSVYNGLAVKYTSSGATLWEQRYPGFWDDHDFFRFTDVTSSSDKLYIVGVDVRNNDWPYRSLGVLGILSTDGELLSYSTFGHTPWTNHLECVVKRHDNEFLLGGYRNLFYGQSNDFTTEATIYATDSTGQELWKWYSPLNELYDKVRSIIPTDDGGLIATTAIGEETAVNSSNGIIFWQCYIFKLNSQLEKEWGTFFRLGSPSSVTRFNKIIPCDDGSGYIAGGIQIVEYIPNGNINEENAWDTGGYLAKISPQGDSIWDRLILHPNLPTFSEYHEIFDIKSTPDGGYLLVGESTASGEGPSQQGWLVKVDQYGCLVPGCHLISNSQTTSAAVEMKLLLYPNPATQLLNVYIGPTRLSEGSYIRILGMDGKEYHRRRAKATDATYILDVDRMPAGSYILQLCSPIKGILGSAAFVKQ